MTELNPVADLALLRVLQLASPALPIGAYAYSQGLEYAIEQNWVSDIDSAAHWLGGLLGHSLARLDIPLLLRQYDALERDDEGALFSWNDWLLANRETAELYLEDSQQGGALLRLLKSLAVPAAIEWPPGEPIALMTALAMAGQHWQTGARALALGALWSWLENQTGAATKLIPLGRPMPSDCWIACCLICRRWWIPPLHCPPMTSAQDCRAWPLPAPAMNINTPLFRS
ncbi:urease accessory UreF family protein [Halopseudomonas pachastrellae]|nr:urease accessory UreF family protein [Halopseudomonas pachastrellae]